MATNASGMEAVSLLINEEGVLLSSWSHSSTLKQPRACYVPTCKPQLTPQDSLQEGC